MNLGILVSGRGSNLQAIIDAIENGKLKSKIVMVVSDRDGVKSIERCERHGIPYCVTKRRDYQTSEEFEKAIVRTLNDSGAELIILAGFMRILSPVFLQSFPDRIINIHPSLTPAFQGKDAQKQAIEFGVRITGCTVHFVTGELDSGPVIAQACVPVYPEDTELSLSERILSHEHRILPQVIKWFEEDRIALTGRQVNVKGATYGTLPFNPELEDF